MSSSKGHDFILKMVQTAMVNAGCRILSSDDHHSVLKHDFPKKLISHKPDLIGYNGKNIFIGEAKYFGDLGSKRTIKQVTDYSNLTKKYKISVIFGIPLSEEQKFLKIMKKNNLELSEKINLLLVPDSLLPINESDFCE